MFSLVLLSCISAEFITDLTVSEDFQERQLKKRHEQFWKVIEAAVDTEDYVEAAEGLAACLDDVPEGAPTKAILEQSIQHLHAAALGAAAQSGRAMTVADSSLSSGPGQAAKGPTDFFARLYRTFVAEEQGEFPDKFKGAVQERQQRVTQILKGSVGSNVLQDTRLASKLAFDVLKYDIYNSKAPKTPEAAKEIANKVVELHAKVRKSFLGPITTMANQIANDAQSFLSPRVQFLPEDPEKHLRASAPAEAGIQVVEEHQAAV
jgi:hypothetical protein